MLSFEVVGLAQTDKPREGNGRMFVGHYSVSFAAKPLARRVPLWVWFVAVQWLDVIWAALVLLGIEKLRIVPGFTEANSIDLYYMPYSHGLPGSIVLSVIFGSIVAFFGDTAKVGLGLWRHVALSLPLEFVILGLGAWLYARETEFAGAQGRYLFWGFIIFLAVLQVYSNFGPTPSSPEAFASTALIFYALLTLLAAAVERFATVSTESQQPR